MLLVILLAALASTSDLFSRKDEVKYNIKLVDAGTLGNPAVPVSTLRCTRPHSRKHTLCESGLR
jgi:hypothetical protein